MPELPRIVTKGKINPHQLTPLAVKILGIAKKEELKGNSPGIWKSFLISKRGIREAASNRLLDNLEKSGFMKSEHDPATRRRVFHLTETGRLVSSVLFTVEDASSQSRKDKITNLGGGNAEVQVSREKAAYLTSGSQLHRIWKNDNAVKVVVTNSKDAVISALVGPVISTSPTLVICGRCGAVVSIEAKCPRCGMSFGESFGKVA